MATDEQVSSPLALGLWTDEPSAAAIESELVSLAAVESHLGVVAPRADTDSPTSHMPWPSLHQPVLADGASRA